MKQLIKKYTATLKGKVDYWAEESKQEKRRDSKNGIIKLLTVNFSTEETLEIEEYVSNKLREILTERLEKITKEKEQLEQFLR